MKPNRSRHLFRLPERRRDHGFTLVELMITLVITAILLGIGIPTFTQFTRSQGVKTASMDITSMLVLARSEAIKRNTDVVVTRANGGWQNGWAVTVTVGSVTTTLNSHAAFSGLTINGSANSITYGSNGRIQNASAPTFEISGASSTRCVSVNLSGLPSGKTGAC